MPLTDKKQKQRKKDVKIAKNNNIKIKITNIKSIITKIKK